MEVNTSCEWGVALEGSTAILGIKSVEAFDNKEEEQSRECWDEMSGRRFDPRLGNEARKEEIRELVKH